MNTDAREETVEPTEGGATDERSWIAEQVELLTLEDGFDS